MILSRLISWQEDNIYCYQRDDGEMTVSCHHASHGMEGEDFYEPRRFTIKQLLDFLEAHRHDAS